jgi:hypothetical protein
MMDDEITILRSDQFVVGQPASVGIVLRNESGALTNFPLLVVQPTLANRAAPPNGIGVRSIEGELVLSRAGRTLFRSEYIWYRMTSSVAVPDSENKADRLVFESAVQTAPLRFAGRRYVEPGALARSAGNLGCGKLGCAGRTGEPKLLATMPR